MWEQTCGENTTADHEACQEHEDAPTSQERGLEASLPDSRAGATALPGAPSPSLPGNGEGLAGAGGGGGPGPRRGSRGQSSLGRTELMKEVARGPPPQVPVLRTPQVLLEGSLDPRQQAVWIPGPVLSPGWCSHCGGRLCVCTGGRRGHVRGEGSRRRRGRGALVAPGVSEGRVQSQHSAAACRVRGLLGRGGAGPRRFCWGHQVERPVGEA